MPIPLKDNVPTLRLPIVTLALVVVNLGFFAWQLTIPGDRASPEVERAGIEGLSERDQSWIEYGAIPYRLLNPGSDCAIGAVGPGRADVVCEGTESYERAEVASRTDPQSGFVLIDAAAWWLTILTSMFMHGGFLHIAFNMLFLWIFGNNVEDAMGRVRFLLFYLLAGAVAVYAQTALDPDSTVPTIGASGAVAGVLGAYLLLLPRAKVLTLIFIIFFVTLVEIPAYVMLGIWFVLQFLPAIGQVATPDVSGDQVAYFAHVGGFLFGLALVKLFMAGRPALGDGRAPAAP